MQIHTDRLFIRNMTAEDWRSNQAIIQDFNQSNFHIYDMPLPEENDKVKALTGHWANSGLFFSVFLANTSEMIGYVCFHHDNGSYDLGYCFHSAYHGKGYAFESCTALMHYLAQTRDVTSFTASTALENTPSCHLLEHLGFTLQKTEQISFHKDSNGSDIFFHGGSFIKN